MGGVEETLPTRLKAIPTSLEEHDSRDIAGKGFYLRKQIWRRKSKPVHSMPIYQVYIGRFSGATKP